MSVDGAWEITIDTPLGKQFVTLTIATELSTLSGTATLGDETVPFLDPKLADSRLTWSQKVTKPFNMTIYFDVQVDGNVMTGTAKAGIFPATRLNGERKN